MCVATLDDVKFLTRAVSFDFLRSLKASQYVPSVYIYSHSVYLLIANTVTGCLQVPEQIQFMLQELKIQNVRM